jgi:cytochrome c-type protein NapC
VKNNKTIWQPSKKWWMFGLPVGAIVAAIFGVLAWGGFNWTMEITNTEDFCISCHEMEQTVYQEYKESIHFKNSSGVKASCPDCHVPRQWIHKVVRKIKASNEIFHKILGTIDTPEKFEKHRLEMAERVWAVMKETDSRECRNCHSFEAMDLESQPKRASRKHHPTRIAERGETCIDCHKGIAHELPEEDFSETPENDD